MGKYPILFLVYSWMPNIIYYLPNIDFLQVLDFHGMVPDWYSEQLCSLLYESSLLDR